MGVIGEEDLVIDKIIRGEPCNIVPRTIVGLAEFWRTTGINSQRIAQLKSKCIISRMWPLLFPASFKPLTQSSTGSGFTWAIGTSRHLGFIWVLIQLAYRERVT